MLPAVLASYEFCLSSPSGKWIRTLAGRLFPYFAVGAAYAVLPFGVLGVRAPVNEFVAIQGLYAIGLTFVKALAVYLRVLRVPYPLSAHYSMPFAHSFLEAEVFLSALALGVLVWAALRTPLGRFLCAWFLWATLPVSNFVPIGAPADMGFVMAERFLYLPPMAFCAAVGIALARVRERAGARGVAMAVSMLAVYVGLAGTRNRDWRDEATFYEKTLARAPFACLLHFNLGLVYRDHGRMADAEKQMRETIGCDAKISEAHNNLGNLLYLRGDRDAAIEEWKAAVRLKPGDFQAWYNLGTVLDEAGRREEAREAYRAFLQTARLVRDPLIAAVRARVGSWDWAPRGVSPAGSGR